MQNGNIFNDSKKYIPGGINAMATTPVIKNGKGVVITDENGKEYIDFVLANGSLMLGHSNDKVVQTIQDTCKDVIDFGAPTKLELRMAELLCETMPNVDMVKMVNSEREAIESAINLAKEYTKRSKIVKFSGVEYEDNTLICTYNDEKQVRELFKEYGKEIAAVIIEPVSSDMGVSKANESFIKKLRMYCDRFGALLIFNESTSGFRVAFQGAQSLFNIKADLVVYSKIIGGGLPLGAFGGKKKIMEKLSQNEQTYANPLILSAGLASINQLYDHPEYYNHIERIGNKFEDGLKKIKEKYNLPMVVTRFGGMMSILFTDKDVEDCDVERFNRYFNHMSECGFYLSSSQFEPLYLSTEHNITHIFKFIKAFEEFAKKEMN